MSAEPWFLSAVMWKSPVAQAFGLQVHKVDPYQSADVVVPVQLVTVQSLHVSHLASLMLLEGFPRNQIFHRAHFQRGSEKLDGSWVILGAEFPEVWQTPIWKELMLAQIQGDLPKAHRESFLSYMLQLVHTHRSSYPPPPANLGAEDAEHHVQP